MEWKKIDKLGEFEAKGHERFFLLDEYDDIFLGFTSFDYYDAEYWFPVPKMPFKEVIITNDACIPNLLSGN